MKKVLVIGAGFLQRYVIRRAKELGYYTLAVDGNPNAIGFADADEYAAVNIVDQEAVCAYAREKGVEVGIIPCADGGSCLDQWAEGELLFDHACYMAELASRTSVIAGVLWHQGESDCAEDRYPVYGEKLTAIIRAFRKKPYLADVPFLLGGLGDYLKDCPRGPKFQNYPFVNTALQAVAEKTPAVGFVSAEGLGANPDNLHFSAAALREFGLRYYEEFCKLEDPCRVYEKEPQQLQAGSDIELL